MRKTIVLSVLLIAFWGSVCAKPPPQTVIEQVKWFIEQAKIEPDASVSVQIDEDWYDLNAMSKFVWQKTEFLGYQLIFSKMVDAVQTQYRWFVIAHEVSHIVQYKKFPKDFQGYVQMIANRNKKEFELEADGIAGELICKVFGKEEGAQLIEVGLDIVCKGGSICKTSEEYAKFSTRLRVALMSCAGGVK